MSNVKVEFLSLLTDIAGTDELEVFIENKTTLDSLLKELKNKFGKNFDSKILDHSGNLSKYIMLVINGEQVQSEDNMNTILQDGDEISFIPAIAGG